MQYNKLGWVTISMVCQVQSHMHIQTCLRKNSKALSWEVFLTQHEKSEIPLWKQGSIKVHRHHEWVQGSRDTYHIGQGRAWHFPYNNNMCKIRIYIHPNNFELYFLLGQTEQSALSSSSYPIRYWFYIYIYILIIKWWIVYKK